MSECRAGTAVADLVMNSSLAFGNRMSDGGMLMNYTPQGAEHIADQWKDEGHWYAMGLTSIGIGYNTDAISDEARAWIESIETWEAVFDEHFKGRSAMVDGHAGGSSPLDR